jgi:hypothetical protein
LNAEEPPSPLPSWRKSSFSGTVDCLEVCRHRSRILVRDSKNPGAGELALTAREWGTFLAAVRAGVLDR